MEKSKKFNLKGDNGKMTEQEKNAILSYVANNFISPLCDNKQSGDELYLQYSEDKFNKFVEFINNL